MKRLWQMFKLNPLRCESSLNVFDEEYNIEPAAPTPTFHPKKMQMDRLFFN